MATFQEFLRGWPVERRLRAAENADSEAVLRALNKDGLRPQDFLALLSPAAAPHLEAIAQKARDLTLRYFGRSVQLFTPLYLSDICTNQCRYCGFNAKNKRKRRHLTVEEAFKSAASIAVTGLRHILLLTGDARKVSSPEYIASVARRIKPLFASIGVEVYALTGEEYALLTQAGVDSVTMFQETYTPRLYAQLHPVGPKRDYAFRLAAPERAASAGMRSLGIGALFGLERFVPDAFAVGIHAWWLQRNYPGVEISVSVPRIRPHEGDFAVPNPVEDRLFVQYIVALRCFLPRVGITCSTRENAFMRDHIAPLGVTRISAGVSTAVGGVCPGENAEAGQFEIADTRTVEEVRADLAKIGYQAVVKDWEHPVD
ncbi:MAG: 2-iminoacetate synthase [Candidatus Desulfovibrio kirbyi]|jgi:2-iminoacetate synthase|uniref:2-iminoacetate synthase n=1 Tax=Candidatus Desulfovibrio kirbyi TaxID=2696086 RepID=A0A6L2R645_9BACT|nr:2-iminoacetate synthase ThiH [Desulfovibrio sp.]GFH63030.1 MAG: 2-iminoacetate synthase [Candidatus Desulfovibrio kirbyi]